MTSADGGVTWQGQVAAASRRWYGIRFLNGKFLAFGYDGDVMSSRYGIAWTLGDTGGYGGWSGAAYGAGTYVIVGYGDSVQVMSSTDLINWEARTAPALNGFAAASYGAGLFVAVAYSGSGNNAMTSPDGVEWTIRTTPDNEWYGITYAQNQFVAVAGTGDGNNAMTSPDGQEWTLQSAVDAVWYGVTYGSGIFVAVSHYGSKVMTSMDGVIWVERAATYNNGWSSVAYGNGVFAAVAYGGPGQLVMTSGSPPSIPEVRQMAGRSSTPLHPPFPHTLVLTPNATTRTDAPLRESDPHDRGRQ